MTLYSTLQSQIPLSASTDTILVSTIFGILGKQKALINECFCLTGNYLSSQAVSSQVLSAYKGLTTVFGMGTGGTP